jgi:antitoxin component YwqK of YwqJK toxin-antitoxin module
MTKTLFLNGKPLIPDIQEEIKKQDKKNGIYKLYNSEGKFSLTCKYKNKKLHGLLIVYHLLNPIFCFKRIYSYGIKKEEWTEKNNLKEGIYQRFHFSYNNILMPSLTCYYENNLLEGLYLENNHDMSCTEAYYTKGKLINRKVDSKFDKIIRTLHLSPES